MSIGSIGSNASQVWHHQKESKTQQASSTNGTGSAQASRRGSFPDVQADAASSPASTGASTGTGTSGSKGISGPASKLIADVNSLLISLQAGNTATNAAPAAGNAGTASSAATGAASADATAAAASSSTAGSSSTGSLSQDQLAGLSTVLNDLGKVRGGGGHHHGHGGPSSGAQSANAGGTGAAAIPDASAASPAPPASGSTSSDLLAQLGKALSAYGTSQASATSLPSTLIAA